METPKMVVFVVKQYAVREAKKMAVRSTQCQNRAVRSTQRGRGCHPHVSVNTRNSIQSSGIAPVFFFFSPKLFHMLKNTNYYYMNYK